ncbi:hypothetical protein conserved [Leishmania donovani]|uniref:Uncharacterized protein n=3 Tax=Leishmania donovani species complex TaxID=38574 RepID=A4I5Q9_LEIIN|nr:conserved hypothetical protein [Leishmania infantum JPCM5]XP_003862944.1 hypothetical protein, conserved [Leishmania donovani]CAC9514578.1 hypothetical_protein_-_conserved [Leishmania infantum]AYU81031.1 hypothetical protein LdCL_300028700 [Leishmania donovani]CAJ1991024.1 hypothetical protein conserved [Leishmania donovani]CAM70130.1 conserved hypothetical protein [Leishmania infantum JPCM5]CBZ36253.1 hypothetical protein, conserved [Leishmania donovani]|eukprot:XP_001467078.1 conserved hypothetical protein [Leishmania infantum JPCM5]
MHAKVLGPLAGSRIQAAHKFPQLRLQPTQHRLMTRRRQCNLPLRLFHPSSVDFARHELEAGRIVEVRRDDNSLVALGFYEPHLKRVDVFDMTASLAAMLPAISEDFFMARVHEAWERRRRILPQTQSNTYRVVNGYADSLPSLFVDVFSECFVRVVATSFGAERLVTPLLDFLSRRGAEDVLLDTPTLGDTARVSIVTPTISLPQLYVEGGVSHLWLRPDMRMPSTENLFLINPAHRRTRRMMRDVGKGKRVLTIYDRSGSAAMNAVMTAKHVTVLHREETSLEWARANLICNHSASVFKTCETVCCDPAELRVRHQQDVVYIECHPKFLSTSNQWAELVRSLANNKVIGVGTMLIVAQEEAPLGVHDLLPRRKVFYGGDESKANQDCPMKRRPLADALRNALEKCHLRLKFLRAFSVACDHPLLPESESASFSQVYLIEGPALEQVFRVPTSSHRKVRTDEAT